MKEVAVNIRMSEDTKALWKELAKQENRSMGGYIEWLLIGERDRIEKEQFTLKDIMELVHRVLKKLDAPKKVNKADKGPSPIHDVTLHESLPPKLWEAWVIHKRKMGVPMNHYHAQLEADHLSRLAEGESELEGEIGWVFDIKDLLNELIITGKKSIFIPISWRSEPKRK